MIKLQVKINPWIIITASVGFRAALRTGYLRTEGYFLFAAKVAVGMMVWSKAASRAFELGPGENRCCRSGCQARSCYG